MTSSVRFSLLAIQLLLACVGARDAVACGNGNVLFEDSMQSLDDSWGWTDDATRSVSQAGLTWTLAPSQNLTVFNQTSLYTDFEICVDLTINEHPEKSGAYLGVAFWGFDAKNNYTVDLFPADGAISVFRSQNNKLLKPVPYFNSDAVDKKPGATNELSVVVTGKHAVISVNGKKVKEFNGAPPAEGGLAGLDFGALASDSGPTTLTISHFQVREPPEQAAE